MLLLISFWRIYYTLNFPISKKDFAFFGYRFIIEAVERGTLPRTGPFEKHIERYENWFVRNRFAYLSELKAVRVLWNDCSPSLEIGVGSGLFAAPLKIEFGVEPAYKMAFLARERGINVIRGIAEALPLKDDLFCQALMVTTICFVDDPLASIREAARVLKHRGHLVIGLVDKESPLGRRYEVEKEKSLFYREATFYSTDEVIRFMKQAGFGNFSFSQAIFSPLEKIFGVEQPISGYGKGSFVVIRGTIGKS